MIDKSFVESITGLVTATNIKVGDREFATREVFNPPLPAEPLPVPIPVSTLTGLVDYCNAFVPEGLDHLLHVVSPSLVQLISKIEGVRKQRSIFVNANCSANVFNFGNFFPHAQFMIALQSYFEDFGDRANVLKVLGTIKEDAAKTSMDDGITQRVTASAGVTLQQEVSVPNPVLLKPFRTFLEVPQPPSMFVLRVNSKKDALPEVALFEADGGRWKSEAMASISEYLSDKTKGITILA